MTVTAEMSLDTTFAYSLDLENTNSDAFKAAVTDIKNLLSHSFDSAAAANGLTVDEISITFSRVTFWLKWIYESEIIHRGLSLGAWN